MERKLNHPVEILAVNYVRSDVEANAAAREVISTMLAEEDADRDNRADDNTGYDDDWEETGTMFDTLPEMDIIMANLYD